MSPRRGVAQTCAGTIGFSGAVRGLSAHLSAGSSQLMHCRSVRPEMVTTGAIRFPHFGQRVSRSMRPSRIFTPQPGTGIFVPVERLAPAHFAHRPAFGVIVPFLHGGPEKERRLRGRLRRIDMTVLAERAVLAGGCFWGVQDLLRRYPRALSTPLASTARPRPH